MKDAIGPRGSVSMVKDPAEGAAGGSDDVDSHTKTNCLRVHHAALDSKGEFVGRDEIISTRDEPDHQALCDREQAFLLRAVREDLDLSDHLADAVNSLRIVLAADDRDVVGLLRARRVAAAPCSSAPSGASSGTFAGARVARWVHFARGHAGGRFSPGGP